MHAAFVVKDAHDVAVPEDTNKTSIRTGGVASTEPEITRRDVHTASSLNAQRRFPKSSSSKEDNLVHQAALRRSSVKGKDVIQENQAESSTSATNSNKPVLVRAPSKADMKKKPKPRVHTGSPKFPALESFSFQDILASIGPEADASIDAIAEICGRSKMSLAEEHGSQLPPHVQLMNAGSSPAESLPSMRLETVTEASSTGPQTRSKSRSLALANASGDVMSSEATAATSNVTSYAYSSSPSGQGFSGPSNSVPAPLLSQIFAWLRRSNLDTESLVPSERDPGAARVLQSVLSDSDSIKS